MITTPCRLCLVTPPRFDPDDFARRLAGVLAAIDIASVELRLHNAHVDLWVQAITALLPVTQPRDVALLLADRPDLAIETGCDGVYLPDLGSYGEARRALGSGAIIGVAAQGSRHQAMEAGELGADFIGIGPTADGGPDPDLIAWWAELMEVPCVAYGVRDAADGGQVVEAGADFLCPDPSLWDAPEGAVAALTRILGAMPVQGDRSQTTRPAGGTSG